MEGGLGRTWGRNTINAPAIPPLLVPLQLIPVVAVVEAAVGIATVANEDDGVDNSNGVSNGGGYAVQPRV